MPIYRLGNDVEIKLLASTSHHVDVGHDTAAGAAAGDGKGRQSPSDVQIEQTANGWSVDLTNFTGRIEVYRLETQTSIAAENSRTEQNNVAITTSSTQADATGDDQDKVVTDDNKNDDEQRDDKKATKTSDAKNTPVQAADYNVLSALNFETSPVALPPVPEDVDVNPIETDQEVIHGNVIENLGQPDEVRQQQGINLNRLLSTPSLKKVSWRLARRNIFDESHSRLGSTGMLNERSASMVSMSGSFAAPVSEASFTSSSLGRNLPPPPPPTRLHQLCSEDDVTLEELSLALEMDPESAKVKDGKGRYPLHVLGDNDELVSTATGRHTATVFAAQLMAAHPDAMLTLDEQGLMPFVSIVRDWLVWVYRSHEDSRKSNKNSSAYKTGMAAILGFSPNAPPSEDSLPPVVDTYTASRSRYSDNNNDEALAKSSRVFPRQVL
jgi:hypothetical protein